MTRRVSGDKRKRAKESTEQVATVHVNQLMECVCAIHLSSYVDGPFPERGGLMLVGPPANFKTTVLEILERNYPDAITLSDMNVRALSDIKEQLASGKIRTLVFSELAKLYERHPQSALNLEGHIRALVAEGFSGASFEDSRMNRLKARCTVLAAMTTDTQEQNFTRWEKSGFNRRFLWGLYALADPHILTRAVEEWKRIEFGFTRAPSLPDNGVIPMMVTEAERRRLRMMVKYQPGGDHAMQVALMVKVLSVLRWHYQRVGIKRNAMETVEAFGQVLSRHGAHLVL